MSRWLIAACSILGCLAALPDAARSEQEADLKTWNSMVDRGIAFLKKSQGDNGGWSTDKSPGLTGIVVTALLRTGRLSATDEPAAKGITFIEGLVNPSDGHLAGKNATNQLLNYVTSVNVMALAEADPKKYAKVIADATAFLKKLQWDEDEGKNAKDDFYGGAGYDSKSRPDLSNTQMFLDALKAAGVSPDDPAYKRAAVFVSRCQNLKGEHNDQPWADKINDGSFIYSPAAGGSTKAEGADGKLPGYGSMTYAGIKSMIYCGVTKDDPRIKKALEWIRNNYTLDCNPGFADGKSEVSLYYYYHTMAKCLDAAGIDEIVDKDGKKHDWRAELRAELAKRQREDGSWQNAADRWMEGDPNLATSYALLTLSYCKPKK